MESRNISTIMAAITEIINEHEVTTRTENDDDFGCPAPSSLLTLTLFKTKYMLIACNAICYSKMKAFFLDLFHNKN